MYLLYLTSWYNPVMVKQGVGILKLTRFNRNISISLGFTFIGMVIVLDIVRADPIAFAVLMAANFLSVIFTFMINDIEDTKSYLYFEIREHEKAVNPQEWLKEYGGFNENI